jgi:hypothetical protein
MATDTDTSSADDPIPKGGLFGGPFDSTGLDYNTRALLIDFRWTTSNDGPQPATTIPYSFPTQTSDYTSAHLVCTSDRARPFSTGIGAFCTAYCP